ncbi:YrdB family protein [Spirosoma sp.]|uniref:YrdB family protein n=1 Tax=Spirosoma sp. TaxID=1899569 RepID=UPI003B3AE759
MPLIRAIHQAIYFMVELSMLASLSYAGFSSAYHNYLLGIGLPLSAIILWGIFAAPRSTYRLDLPYRSLFTISLFGLSAFLLYQTGQAHLAILFGSIALLSEIIALLLQD